MHRPEAPFYQDPGDFYFIGVPAEGNGPGNGCLGGCRCSVIVDRHA